MRVFAISDLHLSFESDKPMDIFKGWNNYCERLENNWKKLVEDCDTVVLPGDFSWALKLSETVKDFEFIEKLPGKKILLKGNHDLWWSTSKKLREFLESNGFDTVDFIFNSSYAVGKYAICGTRGWVYEGKECDKKIVLREAGRLEASILSAIEKGLMPLVFLHYPPVYGDYVCNEIFNVIKRYGIKNVYHGHIHGSGLNNSISEYDGVKFKLLSCDCIDFTPFFVVNTEK